MYIIVHTNQEVDMNNTQKEHLIWLELQLNRPDDSFRHSECYKILKRMLSERGNWKNKVSNSRGNVSNLVPYTKS